MKWVFALFPLLPFFLFAEEYSFPLGELGSVRYTQDNQRLEKIERLLPNGEVLYTHMYHYNEQGQLLSESLIGDIGNVEYGPSGCVAQVPVKKP